MMMNEEIKSLDELSYEKYREYIENIIERGLNDFEAELLPKLLQTYHISQSALFLAIAYLFSKGKNLAHLEPFVKNWTAKGITDFAKARSDVMRLMSSGQLDEEIHRVVGIKNITNQWRDYFRTWKEWGVSDSEIKSAKMICLKRQRSVIPQYMNGIIKEDILRKRRK